jgi:hypothetical protein
MLVKKIEKNYTCDSNFLRGLMCFHSHMECFCCSSFDKHNTKKSTFKLRNFQWEQNKLILKLKKSSSNPTHNMILPRPFMISFLFRTF